MKIGDKLYLVDDAHGEPTVNEYAVRRVGQVFSTLVRESDGESHRIPNAGVESGLATSRVLAVEAYVSIHERALALAVEHVNHTREDADAARRFAAYAMRDEAFRAGAPYVPGEGSINGLFYWAASDRAKLVPGASVLWWCRRRTIEVAKAPYWAGHDWRFSYEGEPGDLFTRVDECDPRTIVAPVEPKPAQ